MNMHHALIQWGPLAHGLFASVDRWPWWTWPIIGMTAVSWTVTPRRRRSSRIR